MWFKNIRIYRFTKPFTLSAEELNEALATDAFVPCGSQDQKRIGWVSPISGQVEQNGFVHANQNYIMVCAKRQEKILPTAVVNEFLAEKVSTIEDAEDRKVGRKQRLQLKDEVMMDLLPKAFTRSQLQYAYIAPEQGYLVVDAASATRAEELINTLRDTLGSMAVVPLSGLQQPVDAMTSWVTNSLAPENTLLGEECELADAKEAGSVIRCKQQDLASTEIANLLASGMLVTKLALSWMEGVSFMLDEQLAIKRLRFEDKIREKTDDVNAETLAEQFDIEFAVMTIELSALINDLMASLGGVKTETASVEEIVAKATRDEADNTDVEEVSF
ncbi:MAG TPA: recombination-associated protein RdgC [Oceanospirillaceae bacterium]|nr:recombination-associated protein RdgC [Oceanospirillaceae bacterium]